MTLDQLRVFVAVAQRQHLTRGAEAVHLSPPAATAAIQALEGRHGVKLFHRVSRRLELTEVGRAFLIRHKQRFRTKASLAFEALLLAQADAMARRQLAPEYDI